MVAGSAKNLAFGEFSKSHFLLARPNARQRKPLGPWVYVIYFQAFPGAASAARAVGLQPFDPAICHPFSLVVTYVLLA